MQMSDWISRSALLAAYDAAHKGPPGKARKLIEEAPTVSGWISVKDRLPDKAGKYLIARKGTVSYIDVMWFQKILRDYKGDSEFDWIVRDVTHWMPLPEPPKED